MTHQLIELINTALNSEDNTKRAEAEGKVFVYLERNPSELLLTLAQILGDSNVSIHARQSSGTVASRLLSRKNKNQQYYWDDLNLDGKERIKSRALKTLASESTDVMKTGAIVIAEIAAIQLPRKQWEDIVDRLIQGCKNDELTIKVASITTIGFICEKIKLSGCNINPQLSVRILGSIIAGTRESETILQQKSLKALQDSLSFLSQIMHQAIYRDIVFEVFLANFKQQKHLELTYHAIFEFMRFSSQYVGYYKETLIQLTEAHLSQRNQISILNLQMWGIIGQQYISKVQRDQKIINSQGSGQNFMQQVADDLLLLFMNCLVNKSSDGDENEAMKLSAMRVIECFVRVSDENTINFIISSVAKIVESQDPNHQQASVLLFSTICQYPDKQKCKRQFSYGFERLFELLKSNNKTVVKSSLIGFVRLSESLPEIFLKQENIKQIISTIMQFVKVDLNDIRSTSIGILQNISEGLKQTNSQVSNDPTILLADIVRYYSQNMMNLHAQHTQVNEKLIIIIMNILMSTSKKGIIVQLIEFMIGKYYEVVKKTFQNSDFLVEQIVSVIHIAILAHKNSAPDNILLEKVCALVDFHIKKYGIEAEGLHLLGATATIFGKSFVQHAPKYWNHILLGLNPIDCLSTFNASMQCIGDFARILRQRFYSQANQIMKTLLGYMNSHVSRQIKLSIMNCMGDLVFSLQGYAETFIDNLIELFNYCFKSIYELLNDPRHEDYIEALKESLIEAYSSILFIENGTQINHKLIKHFPKLATFVFRTCNLSCHPTVEYLKNSLQLIYDAASFYLSVQDCQEEIFQVLLSSKIQQLVQLLMRYGNRPDVRIVLDFIDSKNRLQSESMKD